MGLRVVEMPKERLMDFPLLVDTIASVPMKFIIFIDDLSFQRQDECYTSLKAVLEGGVTALPKNALIYATSNRRHLVKENFEDRDCSEVNRRDNMQETLSLSDRFGLAIGYYVPDKKKYLHIVEELAKSHNIDIPVEELRLQAEAFATQRATRSPRTAQQFIKSLL
jgi:predicted AAA+ superfamily ATPase